MNEDAELKTILLTNSQEKARSSRALGVGISLSALVLVLYIASLAKLL